MERRGPFTGGDNPDDPDGAGDEAGVPQRGWLSPEDRLWRHPSEVLGPRTAPLGPDLGTGMRRRRQRRRARRASLAAGVVGAAALATTLAVVLTFVDSKAPDAGVQGRCAEPDRTSSPPRRRRSRRCPSSGHDVMRLVAAVRPSLVGLEPLDGRRAGAR